MCQSNLINFLDLTSQQYTKTHTRLHMKIIVYLIEFQSEFSI